MSNDPVNIKPLAWRILFALPFFIIGVTGLRSYPLLTPFFVLVGAIIVALPLAGMASEWFGNLLFSRGHYDDAPTPVYSIPQARRASGLYEEAMAGFQEIAREHPGDRQAYVEMIDIAIVNLKDPERANRIFVEGMEAMQTYHDKEALAVMYQAIRSRLAEGPPEEGKPVMRVHPKSG